MPKVCVCSSSVCYSAVVDISSAQYQLVQQWCKACRYTGVTGAHSWAWRSQVSLLCMAGIMFAVECLSALRHWPRASPLHQLFIWLLSYSPSKTSVVCKSAVCDWCSTFSAYLDQMVHSTLTVTAKGYCTPTTASNMHLDCVLLPIGSLNPQVSFLVTVKESVQLNYKIKNRLLAYQH